MAPLLALLSMLTNQAGMALSVPLLLSVGPAATTWLRLVGAATVLWIAARPTLTYTNRSLGSAALLGAASFGMAACYAEAIARIPLGMATAIEFAGPLAVAVLTSRSLFHLSLAAVAGVGVMLITLTASGWSSDPIGIGWAAAAALCWAAYILLTKQVGENFQGLQGLTLALTAAALVALPLGAGQIHATAHAWQIGACLALGGLVPTLPFGLEMAALRGMSLRSFGTMMSAYPAVAGLIGWVILNQSLNGQKLIGIVCVVLASVGTTAVKTVGERTPEPLRPPGGETVERWTPDKR